MTEYLLGIGLIGSLGTEKGKKRNPPEFMSVNTILCMETTALNVKETLDVSLNGYEEEETAVVYQPC